MTLKEKFKEVMNYQFYFGVHQSDKIDRASENLEKIADEFAIGFAEFCFINSLSKYPNNNYKELLEIYKNELGL